MKFGIYVHPRRPKIPKVDVTRRIRSAGASYSQEDPDIGIVIGGDGTFGYFGRILSIPLLFVGVKDLGIVGSKARLAELFHNDLIRAVHRLEAGKYSVIEKGMLSVCVNKELPVDVLTDVYLERGKLAGCLRYMTTIKPSNEGRFQPFSDYAIGNGVIVSTSFGAGGYFSYPERLQPSEPGMMGSSCFADDRIGICHILPAYLARKKKLATRQSTKIRYTVPSNSMVQISLLRNVNARLYGTTISSRGAPVRIGDTITITLAKRTAKIVKLEK